MKGKLRTRYIPASYRSGLLDQWQRFIQGNRSIDEYIAKFDEYSMRCDLRKSEDVVLSRFRAGLRDDIKKELYMREVRDLDHAYQIARDHEHFHRGPIYRRPEPTKYPSQYPRASQPHQSRPMPSRPSLSRPSPSQPSPS